MTTLNIKSVAFAHGQQSILKDISLTVETGQIGCLLGPSGCGKSTLLRLIAGFNKPQAGEIYVADNLVANKHHSMSPQDRQVGMLFQDLALFPHLTVTENIAFGLHQLAHSKQQQRVDELLELCRLEAFKSRYPHQLSGGQCQRVALARAMAPKPKLILLDEPFSSVETGLQSALVHEVKIMLQADQSTALWVTHSLEEAFAVADQMGVMLDGRLLQWSTAKDLYHHPDHPDVIRFLNHANLVQGHLTTDRLIKTPLGLHQISNPDEFAVGDTLAVGLLKKNFLLDAQTDHNAVITGAVFQGDHVQVSALLNNGNEVQFYHSTTPPIGQSINLSLASQSTYRAFLVA